MMHTNNVFEILSVDPVQKPGHTSGGTHTTATIGERASNVSSQSVVERFSVDSRFHPTPVW